MVDRDPRTGLPAKRHQLYVGSMSEILGRRKSADHTKQRSGTQVPVAGVSTTVQTLVLAPHPYILELYKGDGDEPVDSVTLPFVANVTIQKSPATSSHFTLGGHHAQYSGYRSAHVNIAGRSGHREIDLMRYNKLRNFLDKVEALRADNENAFFLGDEYKLILNFPWEMERHYCLVQAFNVQRAVGQTTFSYAYSINLFAYGTAHRKWAYPTNLITSTIQTRGPSQSEMGYFNRLFNSSPVKEVPDQGESENTTQYGPWLKVYTPQQLGRGWATYEDYLASGAYPTEFPSADDYQRWGWNYTWYGPWPEDGGGANYQRYGPWLEDVTTPEARVTAVDDRKVTVENGSFFSLGQVLVLFRRGASGTPTSLQGRVVEAINGNEVTLTTPFPGDQFPVDGETWVGTAILASEAERGGDDAGGKSLNPADFDISKDDFDAAGMDLSGGAFSGQHVANHRAFETAMGGAIAGASGLVGTGTSSPVTGGGRGQGESAYRQILNVMSSAETAWSSLWLDYVNKPLAEANRLRNTVVPALNLYRRAATSAKTTIGRYYRAVPEWKAYAAWIRGDFNASTQLWKQSIKELEEMASLSYWRNQFGSSSFGNEPVRTYPVVVSNSNTPVVAVPVESGDRSAFDVADRTTGSRASWEVIRDVNQLRDPFTYADGSPIKPGDAILVPTTEDIVTTDRGELFGVDLAVSRGDLVLDSGGKLALVSGQEAVKQSITHRFRTVRGTNKAFPAFGLAKTINEKQTSTLYGQLWSDMLTQLLRDRRVSKVTKLVLDEGPGTYTANIEYDLVSLGKQQVTAEYTENA